MTSFWCWRAEGSDNIHSPHLKYPWRRCWRCHGAWWRSHRGSDKHDIV